MRKATLYIIICWSFIVMTFLSSALAAGSSYVGEIDRCLKARDITNGGAGAKSIEDYVCPVTASMSLQQVVFQVIMSLEFKKLDDEVKQDLQTISNGSNKDVGQLATNISDLFDISKSTSKYPAKYTAICNSTTMSGAIAYFKEKGETSKMTNGVTTDNDARNFVFGEAGCKSLVDAKLKAYKESAWLLGESAVVKSFKKDKHEYMRKLKDQYEKFLNKWTTYIGQLSVIKDKWPSKVKNIQ